MNLARHWLPIALACLQATYVHAQSDCTNRDVDSRHATLSNLGWKLEAEYQSTRIYNRKSGDHPILQMLAVTTIHQPAWRLYAVIRDIANYPDFMPYVRASEVLSEQGNTSLVFQQLDFPWPISDRFYTIEMTRHDSPREDVYRLSWTLSEEAPANTTGVGIALTTDDGYWLLCAVDERKTFVEYHIHSDPGGYLPTWAINAANNQAVPAVLDAVALRADEGDYAPPQGIAP